MFDPSTGVWLTEDPKRWAAGDLNLMRYVGNSPTNATDPTGTIINSLMSGLGAVYGSLPDSVRGTLQGIAGEFIHWGQVVGSLDENEQDSLLDMLSADSGAGHRQQYFDLERFLRQYDTGTVEQSAGRLRGSIASWDRKREDDYKRWFEEAMGLANARGQKALEEHRKTKELLDVYEKSIISAATRDEWLAKWRREINQFRPVRIVTRTTYYAMEEKTETIEIPDLSWTPERELSLTNQSAKAQTIMDALKKIRAFDDKDALKKLTITKDGEVKAITKEGEKKLDEVRAYLEEFAKWNDKGPLDRLVHGFTVAGATFLEQAAEKLGGLTVAGAAAQLVETVKQSAQNAAMFAGASFVLGPAAPLAIAAFGVYMFGRNLGDAGRNLVFGVVGVVLAKTQDDADAAAKEDFSPLFWIASGVLGGAVLGGAAAVAYRYTRRNKTKEPEKKPEEKKETVAQPVTPATQEQPAQTPERKIPELKQKTLPQAAQPVVRTPPTSPRTDKPIPDARRPTNQAGHKPLDGTVLEEAEEVANRAASNARHAARLQEEGRTRPQNMTPVEIGARPHPHHNEGARLPTRDANKQPISYTAYDLHPGVDGTNRVVIGSDGHVYVTNTHYGTARDGIQEPPFYWVGHYPELAR